MHDKRLESWKEIAAYLNRSVRTVQRWEKQEGLPVQRHTHEKLGSVYASKAELDAWWESRREELAAPTERPTASQLRQWAPAALAAVVLAAGGAAIRWGFAPEESQPTLLTAVPVTTLPGSEYFPSFSPDGSQIAFTWIAPGRPLDIYTKPIDSEAIHQVTHSAAVDLGPAWSPDGQWIAFLRGDRIRNPTRAVLIVPAGGGLERKVGETQPDWGPFVTWTPDSRGLIYSSCHAPFPCTLELVWLDDLAVQQLTSPPSGQGGDTAPTLSPDGRRLLFVRRRGGHTARILHQRLTDDWKPDGAPEPITSDDFFATAPAWSADAQSLFYMSGEVGMSMQLWQKGVSPNAEPRLWAELGDTFFEPGITVNGNRLVTMDLELDVNIWKISLDSDGTAARPTALTRSNRIDASPDFSPDGRRIAFESTRHGGSDIFVMDADGSNVVQLTSLGLERGRTPRWRPDGGAIAFAAGAETGDIFVMDADGGEPKAVAGGPADESLPSWSTDGRTVYFTSDRSGRQEVWAIDAEGGEAVQLTYQGGYRPIASADGEFVYYTKREPGASHGAPLWRVRVSGGEEQVFERPVFHPENFGVGGGKIYYSTASETEGTKGVRVFDPETGEDRELAHIGPSPFTGLSVSPDGSTIVFSHIDSNEADLVMFEVP